jgi:hypothetical protein
MNTVWGKRINTWTSLATHRYVGRGGDVVNNAYGSAEFHNCKFIVSFLFVEVQHHMIVVQMVH